MTQPPEHKPDQTTAPKRWYDHDPVLLEVLEVLKAFPGQVRDQAQLFMKKLEEQVGADTVAALLKQATPEKFGNRWYDADPVVSQAVELLRIVPPADQRKAAQKFLDAMKQQGLSADVLAQAQSAVER